MEHGLIILHNRYLKLGRQEKSEFKEILYRMNHLQLSQMGENLKFLLQIKFEKYWDLNDPKKYSHLRTITHHKNSTVRFFYFEKMVLTLVF